MKITIQSIEARLLNASTMTEDITIIDGWNVKYEIEFTYTDCIQGTVTYKNCPTDPKIIFSNLRQRYDKTT